MAPSNLHKILIMHWHRQRPHEAYMFESPIPSFNSIRHLRFAYCCKVRAMLNKYNQEGICDPCYRLLPDKSDYEILYSHLLTDGLAPLNYDCANCYCTLIIKYPLFTCQLCTKIHLEILTYLENEDYDFDCLPDPVVIYVSGQEFVLRRS